ncbi:hypothetical protein [Paractinoplanes abujensis]|uniref:Uncharacterized protein n=1 Tax=Paractinoplanes abujensis TaxID=882441 RepID=A0A7W7CTT6_9ACTN|nr:hypothetical protein [Actinoplanes abujensis]MBB4694575.1 hypothetical protein [Actinoplanes abujensis]
MSSREDSIMPTVIHQPRVAWDGARAFVQAAGSPQSEGFAARVLSRLGSEMYGHFADTRQRLLTALVETGGDRYAADIEAGKWRVRLEDLLRERPELTGPVLELTGEGFEL